MTLLDASDMWGGGWQVDNAQWHKVRNLGI